MSSTVHERELGIFVLYTVLENIVEGLQEHMDALFKLLEGLLQDPESGEVRVTAVRALGVIAQYISSDEKNEIRAFQALLPAMIVVVQQCSEAGDEQNARHLLNVFETLLILVCYLFFCNPLSSFLPTLRRCHCLVWPSLSSSSSSSAREQTETTMKTFVL